MISELATAFVPMVLIVMADGTEVSAVGGTYPSYESCYLQAEADGKIMAREADAIDDDERIQAIKIWCEPMPSDYKPHTGYLPYRRSGGSHD